MNKLKYLIMLLLFAAVLVFAILGYRWLSDRYVWDNIQDDIESVDETENSPSDETIGEQPAPEEERTGEAVPDFTVYDMSGNQVNLSDYVGKPVVLNFWATWCMPCCMEMQSFEKAYSEYGEDIQFLMINMTDGFRDTEASVADFINENGYTFPVYLDKDSDGAYSFGVQSIPRTCFLWEDGTLMDEYTGMLTHDKLIGYLEKLKEAE